MASKRMGFLRTGMTTIMHYVLWAVTILLGLWVMLTARAAINIVFILTFYNRWVLRAVDRFSLLAMGIFWLIAIIVVEDYLGQGAAKGELYKRFLKIASAQALLGALFSLVSRIWG